MVVVFDQDVKTVIRKMIQKAVIHSLETNEKIKKYPKPLEPQGVYKNYRTGKYNNRNV